MKTILILAGAFVLSFLCYSFKLGSLDIMIWGEENRAACVAGGFTFYIIFYTVKYLKKVNLFDVDSTSIYEKEIEQ